MFLLVFIPQGLAYKVYFYNAEGERVYRTVEQNEFAKYKNVKRRAYIRQPRTNWEITDAMRARKQPYYYKGKN